MNTVVEQPPLVLVLGAGVMCYVCRFICMLGVCVWVLCLHVYVLGLLFRLLYVLGYSYVYVYVLCCMICLCVGVCVRFMLCVVA